MAKKNSSGEMLLGAAAVVVAVVVAVPKEVWIALVVVVALYFVAKTLTTKGSESPTEPASPRSRQEPTTRSSSTTTTTRDVFTVTFEGEEREYGLPRQPPAATAGLRWVPPGKPVDVAGVSILQGMIYVGSPPTGSYGDVEPALVNPTLKVSKGPIDLTLRLTDYWPSYSGCTPDARRAYLQWLSGGRCAPEASIGYVFLFLGLRGFVWVIFGHFRVAEACK